MTLKNIIRHWQLRKIRKSIREDRFYQPLLSAKHTVWDNGTIGLEALIIDDPIVRCSALQDIHDRVVYAGYPWDMDGIIDAHTDGVIMDKDFCTVVINVGENIKYL